MISEIRVFARAVVRSFCNTRTCRTSSQTVVTYWQRWLHEDQCGVHLGDAAERDAHEEAGGEQPAVGGHNGGGEGAQEANHRADLQWEVAADAVR